MRIIASGTFRDLRLTLINATDCGVLVNDERTGVIHLSAGEYCADVLQAVLKIKKVSQRLEIVIEEDPKEYNLNARIDFFKALRFVHSDDRIMMVKLPE